MDIKWALKIPTSMYPIDYKGVNFYSIIYIMPPFFKINELDVAACIGKMVMG
jgi:hypothetical protein